MHIDEMKTGFYQKAIYPVYSIKNGPLYGFNVISLLKQLTRTQWFSRDELIAYQNDKLKKLIRHVYLYVPYYREIMLNNNLRPEDITRTEDLKYFPLLTKNIIRDNYPKMMSDDIKKRRINKASTGGTTGEPISFYREYNTLKWVEAAFLRGLSWTGYRLGDSLINFTHDNWPSCLGKLRLKLINAYTFPGFFKENEIVDYFNAIQKVQPVFIKGSASYLYRISSIWQKNNLNNLKVLGVLSTSEMLYDYQKNYLENMFDCKVYDYYGCNEVPSLAYECEYGNKHITGERTVIETVTSKGENVCEVPGQIVLTDLDNYAMPFIRYVIGDIGTITNDKCKCGRGLNILKKIEGRNQDMLRTLDGNHVPAIFFPNRFHNLVGIKQYQIIQNDLRNITLKIIRNQKFSQKEVDEMKRLIKEVIGNSVKIYVEDCDQIPLTSSGKSRIVISHVPFEL